MAMTTPTTNDCIKRNLFVKVVISTLLALGIFCAIFAIRSCRWFVFVQDESSENRLVLDWSFLPEEELEATISVGIFRYQPFSVIQTYDDDENLNATVATVAPTPGNEAYTSTSNEDCVAYPEFWVGVGYPWKFTSQLCSVLGSILAFVSWCVMVVGANHHWIGIFLLLSTGIQGATVISSLSWCDQYWNCPWLLGSVVNLIAACLFCSCWVLAVWGLVEIKTTHRRNSNRNTITNDQNRNGEKRRQNPGRDDNSNNESTDVEERYPSSVVVTDSKKMGKRIEEDASGDTDSKTTEDVERGQNTIPLRTCDQLAAKSGLYVFENFSSDYDGKWSIADKELYFDASFDDEMKSKTKRMSQSNRKLCETDAKSKEHRENDASDSSSSESSEDNKSSSDDSSSTYSDE